MRGTVAFSMNAATPGQPHGPGDAPNCTDPSYCAVGFSTNIFINYANNTRLDAPGFSIFGTIDTAGMHEVDSLYNGYGECLELCGKGCCEAGSRRGGTDCTAACKAVSPHHRRKDGVDPYCRFDAGGACDGVSLTQLLNASVPRYLDAFPKLDRVKSVEVRVEAGARSKN